MSTAKALEEQSAKLLGIFNELSDGSIDAGTAKQRLRPVNAEGKKLRGAVKEAAKAKRRAKQRWPFIRKRVYPSGAVAWIVDARSTNNPKGKKIWETLEEAETYAEQCRSRRTNEGTAALGNAELASYGKTVQDAISFYLDHLRRMSKSIPVKEAVAEFLAARKGDGKSSRYIIDLRVRLARFVLAFGEQSIGTLTAKEVDEWLRGLNVGALTRNTYRLRVSALFGFAKKREWVRESIISNVEKGKVTTGRVKVLSPAQAAKLLEVASDETLPMWALMMFAGLRPDSEIGKPQGEANFRLDWSQIDFEEKTIFASEEGKTGHRPVPMSENLIAWLQPHVKKSGPVCPLAYHKKLRDDKRKAGFGTSGSETPEEKAAGLKLIEWTEDLCRHSYGSYKVASGESLDKVADWMGNDKDTVKKYYWKRCKPSEATAFWAIMPEQSGKVVDITKAA